MRRHSKWTSNSDSPTVISGASKWPQTESFGESGPEELRRSVAEGHFGTEGWQVRKDGSQFWANVITTALRDENGELQGFARVVRDFSARHERDEIRFEFELQRSGGYRYGASLRFFMALFRRAASSVWRHDDRSAVEQKAFLVRHGLPVIAHLWAKMFHRIAATFTISLIFGSFRVSSSTERPRLRVSPVVNPWIKFRSITCRGINWPISKTVTSRSELICSDRACDTLNFDVYN